MADKITPLYTVSATAKGGRNGHTESSDGLVKFDLSVPKEMGGPGKPNTVTPEHLFAAGYAACYGGALDLISKAESKELLKPEQRRAASAYIKVFTATSEREPHATEAVRARAASVVAAAVL